MQDRTCAACGEPFSWTGLNIGGRDFCCAECASGKPCGCPAHAHGIPVPDAEDPEIVGVEAALSHGAGPGSGAETSR